jgi:hypothetical protein
MNWLFSTFLIAYGLIGLELIETENSSHLIVLEDKDFVGLLEDEEIIPVQELDYDGYECELSDDLEPTSDVKLKASNTVRN